ncbi:hypothetical protein [Bradyrhizobium sp. ORS 86]|uniref:hypothetical protein n=1 Tax=unclassified Bradyrhizobium TaxID=2631580 RepID=UPI00388DBDE4
MTEFDGRIQANLNVVLEEICQKLSRHGGDHEARKFIVEHLIEAARSGKTTLTDLRAEARRALPGLTSLRSV